MCVFDFRLLVNFFGGPQGSLGRRLGRQIFDALFDYALGVSGDDPGDQPAKARIRTHLSREEVEKKLHDAANLLLTEAAPSTRWAGPVFWLAKQIQRISIWATVKVIIKSCSHDGTSVNMFQLRDRLASTIDKGVVSLLRQQLTRLALISITLVSGLSLLIAWFIRQLPI